MIRTVIEVSAEDKWEFGRKIEMALDKLGYEPKQDAEHGRFMADLRSALHDRGLNANDLVNEYRAKLDETPARSARSLNEVFASAAPEKDGA